MEWIKYPENKPKDDILAMAFNEKGFMLGVRALYSARNDVWRLYDPQYRETLTLEVSHYLEIPNPPPLKD